MHHIATLGSAEPKSRRRVRALLHLAPSTVITNDHVVQAIATAHRAEQREARKSMADRIAKRQNAKRQGSLGLT
jgi:hypothetical protein